VSTSSLVLILVVVAVVLIAALVTGVVLTRRRRISLTQKEETPRPGGYQASSGISLTPAAPEATTAEAVAVPQVPVPVEHPVADRTEVDGQPGVGDDASVPRDSAKRGFVEVDLPEEASEVEEIEPTAGRLERLRGKLSKSRNAFGTSLLGLLGAGDLDEDSWQDVEDTLLIADLGAATTNEIVGTLRSKIAGSAVRTEAEAQALLRGVLIDALGPKMDRSLKALPHAGKPAVLLVVGVNGVGKTPPPASWRAFWWLTVARCCWVPLTRSVLPLPTSWRLGASGLGLRPFVGLRVGTPRLSRSSP
jgi:fused signal recognition particle receptor